MYYIYDSTFICFLFLLKRIRFKLLVNIDFCSQHLTIRFIQKIMHTLFVLLVTYFIVKGILSIT
jgi:hypothetical protein